LALGTVLHITAHTTVLVFCGARRTDTLTIGDGVGRVWAVTFSAVTGENESIIAGPTSLNRLALKTVFNATVRRTSIRSQVIVLFTFRTAIRLGAGLTILHITVDIGLTHSIGAVPANQTQRTMVIFRAVQTIIHITSR
jgi:hypothetical protein